MQLHKSCSILMPTDFGVTNLKFTLHFIFEGLDNLRSASDAEEIINMNSDQQGAPFIMAEIDASFTGEACEVSGEHTFIQCPVPDMASLFHSRLHPVSYLS